MTTPSLILIGGPSGSGKSTLAAGLCAKLQSMGWEAVVVSLDSYYRDLRHLPAIEREKVNFDQPEAWEFEKILADVRRIKSGQSIWVPRYDFASHLRSVETLEVSPHHYILLEGLFALCSPELNALSDLRIFVELDETTALARRMRRDTLERGRSPESVIAQYQSTVQPANLQHIYPSAAAADLQISGRLSLSSQLDMIPLGTAGAPVGDLSGNNPPSCVGAATRRSGSR